MIMHVCVHRGGRGTDSQSAHTFWTRSGTGVTALQLTSALVNPTKSVVATMGDVTNTLRRYLCLHLLCFLCGVIVCYGILIPECSFGNTTVAENSPANLTCQAYNGSATWRASPEIIIATCETASCTSYGHPNFSVTYLSANSSRLVTSRTQRSDNYTYICGDNFENATCRVEIAYGPDNVSIRQSPEFYTDDSASRDLNLTCDVSNHSAPSGLSYNWSSSRCSSSSPSTCRFRPLIQDDGILISCTVTNVFTKTRTTSNSYVLDLKYPPALFPSFPSPPLGYAGDLMTLTCNVPGGKPLVSYVTMTCPNHSPSITQGNSGSLTIASLTSRDHQSVCYCRGQWVIPQYYTRSQSSGTLIVYYPPSSPNITRTDSLQFPYLEGNHIQLSCSVKDPGIPSATLSWTSHRQNSTSTVLTLNSLTMTDNSKTATCRAENNYTRTKGVSLTQVFTLQVYYRPVITVSILDNACANISASQCAVTEGQRIHLRCEGDSNPPPAEVKWQKSGLSFSAGGDLYIASADHKIHNGAFTCMVTTGVSGASDSRLPLSNWIDFTIFVKYQVSNVSLTVSSNFVNEGASVTFTCTASGRPTPQIEFKTDTTGALRTVYGGSLPGETSQLSYPKSALRIEDTGKYVCAANNTLGQAVSESVFLHVQGMPRTVHSPAEYPIYLNFTGSPVNLTFDLISYPKPDTFTYTFLGPAQSETNVSTEVRQGTFNVDCTMTSADYAFKCDVTALEFLSTDETGFYRLRAANEKGRLDYIFYVNVQEVPVKAQSSSVVGVAVGGAIAGLVVLVAVGALIAFFIVRRRRNMDYEQPNHPPIREGSAPYTHLQGQSNPQPTKEGDNSGGPTYANLGFDNSAEVALDAHQNTTSEDPGYQNWRRSTGVQNGNFPDGPTAESQSRDNREYVNMQGALRDYENTPFSGKDASAETKKGPKTKPKPKPKPDTKQKPKPNPKPKYLFRHGKRADQNPYSNT